MERNHICKKCGGIAGWDSYYQSWICTRCGDVERKPITNYDRIISKTPEELAEWIFRNQMFIFKSVCDAFGYTDYDEKEMTHWENILAWLKQEAE